MRIQNKLIQLRYSQLKIHVCLPDQLQIYPTNLNLIASKTQWLCSIIKLSLTSNIQVPKLEKKKKLLTRSYQSSSRRKPRSFGRRRRREIPGDGDGMEERETALMIVLHIVILFMGQKF